MIRSAPLWAKGRRDRPALSINLTGPVITDTPRRSRPSGALRAFTLVETMIAMVVILLTFLALLAVVPFAYSNVQTDAIEVQADEVGQAFLDDERNATLHAIPLPTATTVPIDPGESFPGAGTTDTGYGNFSVTPDGCPTVEDTGSALHDGIDVYLCSVSVSWTASGATRTVTVQSYVDH